jgi:cytochrome c biogenesis protein ResB
MVHVGVILLLLGQLLTDVLSSESSLRLREGQAKNYSETERECELAVIDATDPDTDKVVAIPQAVLAQQKDIRHPEMPFTVRVKKFYANSLPSYLSTNSVEPGVATRDVGTRATVKDLPRVTDMDYRDVPSAVVELATPQGSLGSWLVSEHIDQPQTFSLGNRSFQLALRMRRHYEPYSLQLLKFQHDVYAGTDIPKNFASRVVLQRPETGEKREVLIYMNSPLRYAGQTYYQAGFDRDDHGTNLQVVHNPSWLTPYFSCILVGAGLLVQFLTHLIGFATKRKLA